MDRLTCDTGNKNGNFKFCSRTLCQERKNMDEKYDSLSDNSSLAFVKPTWIHACDEKQKMVPHQKYVIVPK